MWPNVCVWRVRTRKALTESGSAAKASEMRGRVAEILRPALAPKATDCGSTFTRSPPTTGTNHSGRTGRGRGTAMR